MSEALARLRQGRAADTRRPSPSLADFFSAATPRAAAPSVFLEWGACAKYDRQFFTRIERQASGLYLRVACVRADEGADYGGFSDSRVLKLSQITGPYWPCPWCGDQGDIYQCDCGFWVCGGRVDIRRNRFYCRKSCGRSWEIGEPATKTQVSEETRRGGQWKAARNGGGMWKAPASAVDNPTRLLLPPAKGPR